MKPKVRRRKERNITAEISTLHAKNKEKRKTIEKIKIKSYLDFRSRWTYR